KSSPLDTLSPAVVDKEIVTTQVVVPNIAEFTFQNPVVNQINLGDLTAGEFDPERSFNAARLPNFNSSLGVNPIEDHPTGSDFWTSAHVEVNHDYSAQEDEESSEVGQEDRVDNPENSPSPASSEHAVDGEDLNVESSNNTSLDEINTNPSEDQEDFPNVKSNELHIEPNISPLKILMEPRIGGKDFVTVFHFDTEAEDEDIPIEDDKAMESSDDQSVDEETQCQKYTTLPCTPQKSPNAGNKDEDSPPIYSPKADISQQSSSPRSILSTTTSFSDSDVIKTVPRWKAKFPIRVCDKGPQPFSLEDQKLKLRYYFINRFDSRLEFLAHPEIELIKDTVRPYLDLLGASGDNITVEHLAKGGFNHAYTLSIGDEQTGAQKQYVFRVAYPTDPYYKMECDVATTEFVRHSTDIPVPIIYIFDSSSNNKLGFEWMLMEKAAGRAVSEVWKDMDYESKINLTHQVADRMDHLSRLEFKKIGGLRMRFTESELEFYVGPIVHGEFYKERRLTHIQNRGPFETLQDYYSAMLDVIEQDVNDPRHKLRLGLRNKLNDPLSELTQELHAILPDIQDRVDTTPKQKALEKRRFDDEDNELMLARAKIDYMEGEHSWGLQPRHLDALVPAIKALKTSLPILCAAAEVPGDFSTMLMHQDLSMNNIFVDERGQIVALIDWEHIQLEPATLIAGCPIFLETDVTSMPSGPGKATNTQSISQEMIDEINQSNQEFYEDQMAEYEKVELYAVYRERLEELKSPILQSLNVDKSGFGYELYSRVFDTVTECFTHVDWVKYHTEGTDDEAEAKESGEVDVESSIETGEDMRCMGGVDDEEALKWKEEEEKARKKRKHGNKGKKGKNRSKSKRTAAKRAKTEKLEM
ncbi:hypothetical protein MMC12_008142, partial [Toensbergia leucococca]|nr:hypothetical protein [Toensbergia leucococca]